MAGTKPVDNGRVDVLIERVSNFMDYQEEWQAGHEKLHDNEAKRQKDLEDCQNAQGIRITRVEERQGIFAAGQAAFSIVAAFVVGLFK